MSALDDEEDGPPLIQRLHSVEYVEDARDIPTEPGNLRPSTEPPAQPFTVAERASLAGTQNELANLRAAVLDGNAIGRGNSRKLDRIVERLDRGANFMSRLSLKIDMQSAIPNGLKRKRVLVVEDDPELLDLIDEMLCRLGCNVTCAGNRLDAESVLMATPRPFDIALVDVRIPAVLDDVPSAEHGLELCRWLRTQHPTVGVIAMAEEMTIPGLNALPVARLEKPLTLDELRDALYSAAGLTLVRDTEPAPPAPALPLVERDPFPGNEFATQPSTGRETPDAKAENPETTR